LVKHEIAFLLFISYCSGQVAPDKGKLTPTKGKMTPTNQDVKGS